MNTVNANKLTADAFKEAIVSSLEEKKILSFSKQKYIKNIMKRLKINTRNNFV